MAASRDLRAASTCWRDGEQRLVVLGGDLIERGLQRGLVRRLVGRGCASTFAVAALERLAGLVCNLGLARAEHAAGYRRRRRTAPGCRSSSMSSPGSPRSDRPRSVTASGSAAMAFTSFSAFCWVACCHLHGELHLLFLAHGRDLAPSPARRTPDRVWARWKSMAPPVCAAVGCASAPACLLSFSMKAR